MKIEKIIRGSSVPILQYIIISWSKEYRGGRNAEVRNKVETKFEIPAELLEQLQKNEGVIPYHLLHYSSDNNFKEPVTDQIRFITQNDNKIGAIFVEVEENKINAMYSYNSKICGAPIRDFLHKKIELQK